MGSARFLGDGTGIVVDFTSPSDRGGEVRSCFCSIVENPTLHFGPLVLYLLAL